MQTITTNYKNILQTMIGKHVDNLCNEDLSLIENYYLAINDNTTMWDCHHRLETELNVSRQYLVDNNIYFNRPASELIFLTHADHIKLHHTNKIVSQETRKKQSEAASGEKNHMYGTHHTDVSRQKISENNAKYWLGKHKGPPSNKGKHLVIIDGKRTYV